MVRIGAFTVLRIIVMLRRIWKSLDRLGIIEYERLQLDKERMALDHPEWRRAGSKLPDPKQAKKVEIGFAEIDDLNKRWKEKNPEYERE